VAFSEIIAIFGLESTGVFRKKPTQFIEITIKEIFQNVVFDQSKLPKLSTIFKYRKIVWTNDHCFEISVRMWHSSPLNLQSL
jgi:hypothetical protein